MGQERSGLTQEDRAVSRLLNRIERGDETLIRRIKSTLDIDSETNPTENDIREFLKAQSFRKGYARKQNRGSQ